MSNIILTKLLFRLTLLFSLTFFSCSSGEHRTSDKKPLTNGEHRRDPPQKKLQSASLYAGTDTLTIALKSAVLFQPDSSQLKKRIEATGENEFRQGADDYAFYMHLSIDFLEKQRLPIVDAKGKRYLCFIRADGKSKIIKTDSLQDLWGIFLFDPGKDPHYADIIEFEDDYNRYFNH